MIDLKGLMGAGAACTRNQLLKQLLARIMIYNNLQEAAGQLRIRTLEQIMTSVTAFLTSRPPSGKQKNELRWKAMGDIVTDIAKEAQAVGVKLLNTPADFKKVQDTGPQAMCFWLEKVDESHRSGVDLSGAYAKWLTAGGGSFWDYLKVNNVRARTVEQLDENARLMYQIHPEGKIWYNHDDQPADTLDCKSNWDGEGYALFVSNFKGEMFIHADEEGFHHSTFLAGGPVVGAGSIMIVNGNVRVITCQSGHYQPSAENMRKFVNTVEEIPDDAAIWPDFAKKKVFHRVGEYRRLGPPAPVLTEAEVRSVENGPSMPTAYGKYTGDKYR